MKKKNGFIAISILYSFFLCFIALMMGLLASYANSALILHKINEPIQYNNKNFKKTLLTLILKEDLKISTPTFAYGAPNNIMSSNVSGLFSVLNDLGTSYYFRGNVTNNYVEFAGFVWRIVRVNEDKTIRLIYDGTTPHANGDNSNDRYVSIEKFANYKTYDKKYAGYTYKNTSAEDEDSNIKKILDNWYNTNINYNYDDYVAEAIFCNDTTTESGSEAETLFYGAYTRNYKTSENNPKLTCPNTDKAYGGEYKLKVGLLSADEAVLAGIGYNDSSRAADSTNYLYIENSWWTLSPVGAHEGAAWNFCIVNGKIDRLEINESNAIRPVINLKEDVLVLEGDGTKNNPYVIDTN